MSKPCPYCNEWKERSVTCPVCDGRGELVADTGETLYVPLESYVEFTDGTFVTGEEADKVLAAQVVHTEPVEYAEQIATALSKLDASWRETLRKERDMRLNEVRLKEKFKKEAMQLRDRLEALQGEVR